MKLPVLAGLMIMMVAHAASGEALGQVEFVPIAEGASDLEIRAITNAGEIANAVKNSDCFRQFIANRRLVETNGRTPSEVSRQIQALSGRIAVGLYFRCLQGTPDCASPTSAVAYRQPPDTTIYLNRAYYDLADGEFDVYEMAGSLAHEGIGHVLAGYDHSFDWTSLRDWSVPYSISGASRMSDDAFQHCRAPLGFDAVRHLVR
jgi:hypothetical protein